MSSPIPIEQAIVLVAIGFLIGSALRLSRLFAGAASVVAVAYLALYVHRLGFERLLQRGVEMLDLLYAHPGMTGGFVVGLVLSSAWSKPEPRT